MQYVLIGFLFCYKSIKFSMVFKIFCLWTNLLFEYTSFFDVVLHVNDLETIILPTALVPVVNVLIVEIIVGLENV